MGNCLDIPPPPPKRRSAYMTRPRYLIVRRDFPVASAAMVREYPTYQPYAFFGGFRPPMTPHPPPEPFYTYGFEPPSAMPAYYADSGYYTYSSQEYDEHRTSRGARVQKHRQARHNRSRHADSVDRDSQRLSSDITGTRSDAISAAKLTNMEISSIPESAATVALESSRVDRQVPQEKASNIVSQAVSMLSDVTQNKSEVAPVRKTSSTSDSEIEEIIIDYTSEVTSPINSVQPVKDASEGHQVDAFLRSKPPAQHQIDASLYDEHLGHDQANAYCHSDSSKDDHADAFLHNGHVGDDRTNAYCHSDSSNDDQADAFLHNGHVGDDRTNAYCHSDSSKDDQADAFHHNGHVGDDQTNAYYHSDSSTGDQLDAFLHSKPPAQDQIDAASLHNEHIGDDQANSYYHSDSSNDDQVDAFHHNGHVGNDRTNAYCHSYSSNDDQVDAYYQNEHLSDYQRDAFCQSETALEGFNEPPPEQRSIRTSVSHEDTSILAPPKETDLQKQSLNSPCDVVICHHIADQNVMLKIKNKLESSGVSVAASHPKGENGFVDWLMFPQAVVDAKIMVVLLSEKSVKDPQMTDEVCLAHATDTLLYPVTLDKSLDLDTVMDACLKLQLSCYKRIQLADGDNPDFAIALMTRSVKEDLASLERTDVIAQGGVNHRAHVRYRISRHRQSQLKKVQLGSQGQATAAQYWEKHYGSEANSVVWDKFYEDLHKTYRNQWNEAIPHNDLLSFREHLRQDVKVDSHGTVHRANFLEFCNNLDIDQDVWERIQGLAVEIQSLTRVLEEQSTVRMVAIENIAKFGSRKATSALRALVAHNDPNIRAVAAMSLSRSKAEEDQATLTALLTTLDDENGLVRETGCLALGHLRARAALGKLRSLCFNDASSQVRDAAAVALKEIERK